MLREGGELSLTPSVGLPTNQAKQTKENLTCFKDYLSLKWRLKFKSKPPEHIEYDGHRYELEEWGRASVTRVGQTGIKKGMSCTYYEYEAPGDHYLTVEQWGEGEFEVAVGRSVNPTELELLPGDNVGSDQFARLT